MCAAWRELISAVRASKHVLDLCVFPLSMFIPHAGRIVQRLMPEQDICPLCKDVACSFFFWAPLFPGRLPLPSWLGRCKDPLSTSYHGLTLLQRSDPHARPLLVAHPDHPLLPSGVMGCRASYSSVRRAGSV